MAKAKAKTIELDGIEYRLSKTGSEVSIEWEFGGSTYRAHARVAKGSAELVAWYRRPPAGVLTEVANAFARKKPKAELTK